MNVKTRKKSKDPSLLKMGQPRPIFRLFSVFSNKQYIFYNKLLLKMSIQYTALGFEPTTS